MPNAAALAAEFVPRRDRAIAVTVAIVCVPLGGHGAAAVFAEGVLPAWGWRTLFVIGGVVPLVVAAVLAMVIPESPRFLARHPARWPELARLLDRFGHPTPPGAQFADASERAVGRVSIAALFEPVFRHDTVALWAAFFFCMLGVYTAFNWVPSMLAGAGLAAYATRGILAFNLGGVLGAIGGALVIARRGSKPTMLTMSAGAVASALGHVRHAHRGGLVAAPDHRHAGADRVPHQCRADDDVRAGRPRLPDHGQGDRRGHGRRHWPRRRRAQHLRRAGGRSPPEAARRSSASSPPPWRSSSAPWPSSSATSPARREARNHSRSE